MSTKAQSHGDEEGELNFITMTMSKTKTKTTAIMTNTIIVKAMTTPNTTTNRIE